MDGIERIKVLASEVKDEQVLEIVNYLLTREDMNEKYLNEEKSLKQMLEFIGKEVKKQFKPVSIGSGVQMSCASNEKVYSIAIHYWDESNKDLGLDKKEEKKVKQSDKSNLETKEIINKKEKTESTKSKKKEWVAEGQLSLF